MTNIKRRPRPAPALKQKKMVTIMRGLALASVSPFWDTIETVPQTFRFCYI
jgi:hypothetical protein